MNIDRILQDARRRIAALDFTAENDRIAAIDQQLADIQAAVERGKARREEVNQLLRPFAGAHHLALAPALNELDGRGIATALLSGTSTADAAKARTTRADLEEEQAALRDGIAELMQQQQDLQVERDAVRRSAARRSFEELRPLCSAYEAQAKAAAETIVQCFAAMSAIGRVTSSNPPGFNAVASAVGGLRGGDRLVSPSDGRGGDMVKVPAEVLQLVDLLDAKGPSLARRIGTTVPPPQILLYA